MTNQEQNQQEFTWINCPNCGRKLFKALHEQFSVEIVCNNCKAIYELSSDGQHISYKQTRKPKRRRTGIQYPNQYK